jgi:hypothetical protein
MIIFHTEYALGYKRPILTSILNVKRRVIYETIVEGNATYVVTTPGLQTRMASDSSVSLNYHDGDVNVGFPPRDTSFVLSTTPGKHKGKRI